MQCEIFSKMTHLNTPAQLATEGREMSHYVGGYRDAVSSGQSHILAIDCGHDRRSTVELSASLTVLQHKARNNGNPASRNEQQSILRRLVDAGGRLLKAKMVEVERLTEPDRETTAKNQIWRCI